jgi:hypothetical protein
MNRILALCILTMIAMAGEAQDTLPKFNAVAKPNNRNLISWTNPYPHTTQISIQRSTDSLKNFKTILTVPDPAVPQNGFVDSKAPFPKMFYRLFVLLDSGKYVFTKSMRPGPDTVKAVAPTPGEPVLTNDNKRVVLADTMNKKEVKVLTEKLSAPATKVTNPPPAATPKPPPPPKVEKYFIVKKRDTVINRIVEKDLKKFRDSIVYTTKDTMVFAGADTLVIKPFVPKEIYKPSKYVYTEKFGNVMLSLPDAAHKEYRIVFFDDNKKQVLELKSIKRSPLILDKTSLVHSGWFSFEIYEEGKLLEKHRFFIPKDF